MPEKQEVPDTGLTPPPTLDQEMRRLTREVHERVAGSMGVGPFNPDLHPAHDPSKKPIRMKRPE